MDRRAFLKRSGTATAVAMAGPLVVTSRGAAQTDRLVVAVGQWGIETPLAWRGVQAEKPLWDCVFDPPEPARSQAVGVPSVPGHCVPALERDEDTDLQAPIGREVPRRLGRLHGGGRQVHGRAELQARRAGRLGLLLPEPPRSHRD